MPILGKIFICWLMTGALTGIVGAVVGQRWLENFGLSLVCSWSIAVLLLCIYAVIYCT